MRLAIAAAFALIAASPLLAKAQPQASAPAAPATPDLGTAVPLPGSWSYAPVANGSEAVFSNATGHPQLWIRCTRSVRRVSIAKLATGAAPFIDVWTSSATRSLPASFNPANARATIELGAFDTLLDAMAFSRGRIGVTVRGQPTLVVPPWQEIARVIEDCRI